jgi:hypothetical protein
VLLAGPGECGNQRLHAERDGAEFGDGNGYQYDCHIWVGVEPGILRVPRNPA